RAGDAGGTCRRRGQTGRLRRLPGRRIDHAMGLCVARRTCGARGAVMASPDLVPLLKNTMPKLRGRALPNQPLAELTWFRVGGPAQLLFMPEDEADLGYFLVHLPDEFAVTVIGLGSNLIVRDGGVRGAVVR